MKSRISVRARACLLAAAMVGALVVPLFPSDASAWCYGVGNHSSASLDWEFNGSDANITWSGDHSVQAVYDTNYSSPTLSQSWVRLVGGSTTKLTAGGGARFATVNHTIFQPYGALWSTSDHFARNLSSDIQACT